MYNKSNSLNYDDDALWSKCQQGGSISSQDLGIKNVTNTEGVSLLTEGCTSLQFELDTKN